ncbi:hypothetical protein V1514DRAFT_235372 [Lipomyces japonicus]|uniref:uncharacterized protein n=1 Tax=Lipomyces japonicus TaxID=56871 RepID=UPI0034CD1A4B
MLSSEVAALSTKLILSVERQADLEDGLAATRHELELAHEQILSLQASERKYQDLVAQGMLVEKQTVEVETEALMNKLMEESKARIKAETDRRNIEQEVEDLTRSLFEEANKMVATERKDNAQLEHRNKQLETIITEKDNLLISLQEQLTALKQVLHEVTDGQDNSSSASSSEDTTTTTITTATTMLSSSPSPAAVKQDDDPGSPQSQA